MHSYRTRTHHVLKMYEQHRSLLLGGLVLSCICALVSFCSVLVSSSILFYHFDHEAYFGRQAVEEPFITDLVTPSGQVLSTMPLNQRYPWIASLKEPQMTSFMNAFPRPLVGSDERSCKVWAERVARPLSSFLKDEDRSAHPHADDHDFGTLMIGIASWDKIGEGKNWLCNLARIGDIPFLLVALDENVWHYARDRGIPSCIADFVMYGEKEEPRAGGPSSPSPSSTHRSLQAVKHNTMHHIHHHSHHATGQSFNYHQWMVKSLEKSHTVRAMVHDYGYAVLLSDMDIGWVENPFSFFAKLCFSEMIRPDGIQIDAVYQNDNGYYGPTPGINSGLYFILPTHGSLFMYDVWDKYVRTSREKLSDQGVLRNVLQKFTRNSIALNRDESVIKVVYSSPPPTGNPSTLLRTEWSETFRYAYLPNDLFPCGLDVFAHSVCCEGSFKLSAMEKSHMCQPRYGKSYCGKPNDFLTHPYAIHPNWVDWSSERRVRAVDKVDVLNQLNLWHASEKRMCDFFDSSSEPGRIRSFATRYRHHKRWARKG